MSVYSIVVVRYSTKSAHLKYLSSSTILFQQKASLRGKRFCAVREQRITGLAKFFAGKTPKTPFFALCSAETLAAQANGRHMNYIMCFSFALLGRSVGPYKQIMQVRILVLVLELRDQAPRVNFALTTGPAETPIISPVDLLNKI